MKLETFFEKFEQFAEAPNAVAKLRELVLHLAAHGKLVEQCSDDEPASDLVNRIESHFEVLLSRNELRFSPLAPLDDTDLSALPSSWQWVRFGNVVAYGSPAKAESANIPPDSWLLDLEDIEKDTSRLLQRKTFHDSPSKSTKAVFEAGDVLYGKLRPYLNKVLVADAPGYCTTEIIPIRTFGFIEPTYLCYALKRPEFLAYAVSKSYGMNLPRLGTADARNAAFPLPPLAEQKRIVTKVDELMALCDRLETQQRERDTRHAALARASLARFADAPTPANLNHLFHPSYAIVPADLRKTILTLAVQGKLVPQDPNDEPASTAVDLVSKEAQKAIRDGIIRRHGLAELANDSELPELPLDWRWSRLAEVTRPVPYAIKRGPFGSAVRKDMFVSEGFKVYEQQHAISGDFTKGRYYITQAKFEELRAFELHPNEILVSCSGTVGKVAIVPATIERGIINQALLKLSLHQSALLNEYFLILFPAFFMETDMLTNLQGTAQKNIPGVNVLREMPFPLPPLAEQRRIVAKVDQLMALVDQLETQLVASRATAANLMEAVVAEMTAQE